MLNHRSLGPIAATVQGDPPGVAKLASSLVSTAIVASIASTMPVAGARARTTRGRSA